MHFVHLLICSTASSVSSLLHCLGSRSRILPFTFYAKSVQEHYAFRFTINVVTTLTIERPQSHTSLKAPFGSFRHFYFLRFCHLLHLSHKTFMRPNLQPRTDILHTKQTEQFMNFNLKKNMSPTFCYAISCQDELRCHVHY